MSFRFGLMLFAGFLLTGCSGSSTPASPTPTPTGTTANASIVSGAFNLTTTSFSPNPLNVAVGTTVTWMNNDVTTHNATADNGLFATGSMPAGASASVKFSTAGSFVYHCTIHPGMVGTVNVQ
jgi:plastocyanin